MRAAPDPARSRGSGTVDQLGQASSAFLLEWTGGRPAEPDADPRDRRDPRRRQTSAHAILGAAVGVPRRGSSS